MAGFLTDMQTAMAKELTELGVPVNANTVNPVLRRGGGGGVGTQVQQPGLAQVYTILRQHTAAIKELQSRVFKQVPRQFRRMGYVPIVIDIRQTIDDNIKGTETYEFDQASGTITIWLDIDNGAGNMGAWDTGAVTLAVKVPFDMQPGGYLVVCMSQEGDAVVPNTTQEGHLRIMTRTGEGVVGPDLALPTSNGAASPLMTFEPVFVEAETGLDFVIRAKGGVPVQGATIPLPADETLLVRWELRLQVNS